MVAPGSLRIYTGEAGARSAAVGCDAVAVIDVLRATTVMDVAFERGAARILPVRDPEAAFRLKEEDPARLLVGEHQASKLEGFDHNNSPAELAGLELAGRELVQLTTNGTRILHALLDHAAAPAPGVAFASYRSVGAASEWLSRHERPGAVCAGWLDIVAVEDVHCAEVIRRRMLGSTTAPEEVRSMVLSSEARFHLERLGHMGDVEEASKLDTTKRLATLTPRGIEAGP